MRLAASFTVYFFVREDVMFMPALCRFEKKCQPWLDNVFHAWQHPHHQKGGTMTFIAIGLLAYISLICTCVIVAGCIAPKVSDHEAALMAHRQFQAESERELYWSRIEDGIPFRLGCTPLDDCHPRMIARIAKARKRH